MTPPTHKDKAITCITSEPITRECEPLEAAWLSNTGATRPAIDKTNKIISDSIFFFANQKINTTAAISAWKARYFPSDIWVMKDRITVRSKASAIVVPKICAKGKMTVPKAPITQIVEVIFSRLRTFSPEVVRKPL
jgi:hypothetical protein